MIPDCLSRVQRLLLAKTRMIAGMVLGYFKTGKGVIQIMKIQTKESVMSSFKALMVHRDDKNVISHELTDIQPDDLPEDGDVPVSYTHLTLPTN